MPAIHPDVRPLRRHWNESGLATAVARCCDSHRTTPDGHDTIIAGVGPAHRRCAVEKVGERPLWDLEDLGHPWSQGIVFLQPASNGLATDEGVPVIVGMNQGRFH